MKKVILKTEDGVEIHGNYFEAENKDAPAVVLLHMMPALKESWMEFQKKLQKAGFQSLAIDERGHGESILKDREKIDFMDFSDKEQREKILDLEGAIKFFEDLGISAEKISIVGASIGANLALWYQSEHSEIKATILLSPGLSYHGVSTDDKIVKLSENQNIFLASGGEEDQYSQKTIKELYDLAKAKKKIKVFEDAKHGTAIFEKHPEFMDEVIVWLSNIYF